MPVRVIGMIGVAPPAGTALHVIGGGVSRASWASSRRRTSTQALSTECMATFCRMAADFGRSAPKFNISFRPVTGRTEGAA